MVVCDFQGVVIKGDDSFWVACALFKDAYF
jgi:hypothetical protein